jgi:hypothetical protein
MIRFDVRLLVSWLQHIEEFEDALLSGALYGGAHELTASRSPDELLTIDGRKWLWAQLGPLQEHLEPLALSVGKIEIQYLWNHANKWSGKEMAARLKDFRSKLERELSRHLAGSKSRIPPSEGTVAVRPCVAFSRSAGRSFDPWAR